MQHADILKKLTYKVLRSIYLNDSVVSFDSTDLEHFSWIFFLFSAVTISD